MIYQGPILAAEDEESDAMLLNLAVKKAGLPHLLTIVHDGQEAVDYLSGEAPFADRLKHPLPNLLLLDLKMPRMTGFEVLAWLATSPAFQNLPAIVLSSSIFEADKQMALKLGAREYFIKPSGLADLVKMVKDINDRWFSQPVAELSLMSAQPLQPAQINTSARPDANPVRCY